MSSCDARAPVTGQSELVSAQVAPLVALIEGLVENGRGGEFPDAALQQLFKACVRLYGQKIDDGQRILPCGDTRDISATSVLVTASGLLKGASLELFELGMWQSFSGTR